MPEHCGSLDAVWPATALPLPPPQANGKRVMTATKRKFLVMASDMPRLPDLVMRLNVAAYLFSVN